MIARIGEVDRLNTKEVGMGLFLGQAHCVLTDSWQKLKAADSMDVMIRQFLKLFAAIIATAVIVGFLATVLMFWVALMFWAYGLPGSVLFKLAAAGLVALLPLVLASILME